MFNTILDKCIGHVWMLQGIVTVQVVGHFVGRFFDFRFINIYLIFSWTSTVFVVQLVLCFFSLLYVYFLLLLAFLFFLSRLLRLVLLSGVWLGSASVHGTTDLVSRVLHWPVAHHPHHTLSHPSHSFPSSCLRNICLNTESIRPSFRKYLFQICCRLRHTR